MNDFFDIGIIGAGPAGCAAAIAARSTGAHVLLIDKDRFPRHKVCGEFVSYEAASLLRSLLNRDLHAPEICQVRLFRGVQAHCGTISAPALSVSRYDLDQALLQAAAGGGAVLRTGQRVRKVAANGNIFAIQTDQETHHARSLINATGRWSELSGARRPSKQHWIGLKAHFQEISPNLSTDIYFFKGGYCGVQPIATNLINVCALVDSSVASTLKQVFALDARLTARSAMWQAMTKQFTTAPIAFHAPIPVAAGIINVGDAAGFIDPFLGDGISIAMQTGVMGGKCLEPFLAGRDTLEVVQAGYATAYRRTVTPAMNRARVLRSMIRWPFAWHAASVPGFIQLAARVTRVLAN